MQGLLQRITDDVLAARKGRDVHAAFLVSTFSDIKTAAKADGNREPTDDDAEKVLRGAIKGMDKVLEGPAGDTDYGRQMAERRALLSTYLPEPMTGEKLGFAIREAADDLRIDPVMKEMGALMKRLNEKFPGQIDGAQVKALIQKGV